MSGTKLVIEDGFVSLPEASALTGISDKTIWNATAGGRLAYKTCERRKMRVVRMDRVLEAIADGRLRKGNPRKARTVAL